MREEQNRGVAEAYLRSLGTKNVEEQISCFADDATVTDPIIRVINPSAPSITLEGKEAIKEFLAGFSFLPPWTVRNVNLVAEGDSVAAEFKLAGKEPVEWELAFFEMLDFEQGRIKHVRAYPDTQEVARLLTILLGSGQEG